MNILNQIIYHQTYIGIDQQNLTNINFFGGANWRNSFIISDINFKVFTNESKIEIHGCNTAFDGELDTLSSLISLALFKAGKKEALLLDMQTFLALIEVEQRIFLNKIIGMKHE